MRVPEGTTMRTSSSTALPISARPIGLVIERYPRATSASSSPIRV
jgi:hypothetical protein